NEVPLHRDGARHAALHHQPADGLLGEPAAHGDEAEHRPEQQGEEDVARVEGREADGEGSDGERDPAGREPYASPRPDTVPAARRSASRLAEPRRHGSGPASAHTGTSISSKIASSTRVPSSCPSSAPPPGARIRCAKHGTTRSRTSLGTRYVRPWVSA